MPLFNIAASAPSIPHSRLIFQERISCPLYVLFLTRKQNLPIVSLVYSQIMYSLKTSLSSLDCSMIAENGKASAFLSSVFDFLRRSKCQTQVILCYCLHVLHLQFGEQIIESYQFFCRITPRIRLQVESGFIRQSFTLTKSTEVAQK